MNYLKDIIEQKYDRNWANGVDVSQTGLTLFYGHRPRPDRHNVFSQWWIQPFSTNEATYCCMEQFMMAAKAVLFNDAYTFHQIMGSKDQKYIKSLGRKVKNFDEKIWNQHKYTIVYCGNYLKFSQNSDLKEILFSTGNSIMAEASPYDGIWGIKLSQNDPRANNPNTWNGTNLLGFALMQVRDNLRQ